ncbi:DNA-binding LytR/AlgR family response regulator [Caulobacter ginsengisoli]|uniref:DNA-binding LytR/AlgR family response regulator n=1 Tax=Caulobacter ginsengisoli TaxID=400775 RepID=A0ABU0IVU4_9CAUL|nr:LytTR family DNA-binding domain-containing protein [Caulobacter ginsengisoli]MDQ0465495.1 DNA-binding LytR/AlgR family response regulator [Caulobacter ginsengisoli]
MKRLWAAAWPWLLGLYAYVATVLSAAWFLRRWERAVGEPVSVATSLLWQGLVYGAWLPVAAVLWLLFRRLGLKPAALLAVAVLGLVSIPGHALVAALLDERFSPYSRDLAARIEGRLPVELLLFTALAAAGAAAHLHRRSAELAQALAGARAALADGQAAPARPERLMVSAGRRRIPVDPAEVEWFASAGNYVVVHWAGREGLLRETLGGLEQRLDPRVFARSHRSALVNLGKVAAAVALSDGAWRLTLQSGGDVVASRTHRDAILARLGRQTSP